MNKKIEILAHRGLWRKPNEMNTLKSFRYAFEKGFGIETDIRDKDGELYISHDPIIDEKNCARFSEFIDLYKLYAMNKTLAINIKSDGIIKKINDLLKINKITEFFFFDMSIPDLVEAKRLDCDNLYARLSEFENPINLKSITTGLCLDSFNGDFYFKDESILNIKDFSNVIIISPELHGFSKLKLKVFWDALKFHFLRKYPEKKFMLCTDKPIESNQFFNL